MIAQGRDHARSEAALAEIRSAAPEAQVDMIRADLSVMDKVDAFASQVAASTDRIGLLVNNAGATPSRRMETADGFEQTFAANHLAVFLLTHRLLPLLKAAAPGSQVITTASVAHKFIKDMKWDDLQQAQSFSASDAYAQSKLANILFTREMAKRVKHDGIRVNCVRPGVVQTNFDSHGNLAVKLMYFLGKPLSLTPEQGADTILLLAKGGAPKATGQYLAKRKPAALSAAAQSEQGAARLWDISKELTAKAGQTVG